MDTVVVEVPGQTATGTLSSSVSGVSWGAVIGGAFIIGALDLLLLALGAGFGLSTVSPWPGASVSLTTFTVVTAVWFIVVQWIAAAVGGYIAGRLRTRWTGLHTAESYFRDTAHGVLAWAVAVVVTAAVLGGAAAMMASGAVTGTTTGASQGATASATGNSGTSAYLVDTLFRSDRPDAAGNQDPRPEAVRILATGLKPGGQVSQDDRAYLARMVAARTGISQDEAQKRVDDTINRARETADTARKATRNAALFTGFALLIGAFVAGVAGKIGGNARDDLAAA